MWCTQHSVKDKGALIFILHLRFSFRRPNLKRWLLYTYVQTSSGSSGSCVRWMIKSWGHCLTPVSVVYNVQLSYSLSIISKKQEVWRSCLTATTTASVRTAWQEERDVTVEGRVQSTSPTWWYDCRLPPESSIKQPEVMPMRGPCQGMPGDVAYEGRERQ